MWNAIVDRVTPYIVKVETPSGHGTGFLCLYNDNHDFCGIATAWHVVSHADQWQQPIRLHHLQSSTTVFLKETDRIIFREPTTDSAVIVFATGTLTLPENLIPLLPTNVPLAIGADVGWLGFPALAPFDICFFAGSISAHQEWRHAYLIDGVAINGVSGGPVVYSTDTEGVQIVGTIPAYVSNTATGDALPGLSIARDLSHFHDTIAKIESLDEARKQKQLQAEEQKAQEAASRLPEPAIPEAAPPTTQRNEQPGRVPQSKTVPPTRRPLPSRKARQVSHAGYPMFPAGKRGGPVLSPDWSAHAASCALGHLAGWAGGAALKRETEYGCRTHWGLVYQGGAAW